VSVETNLQSGGVHAITVTLGLIAYGPPFSQPIVAGEVSHIPPNCRVPFIMKLQNNTPPPS